MLPHVERRVHQRDAIGADRFDAIAALERVAFGNEEHAVVAREHDARRTLVHHLARDAVRHRRRRGRCDDGRRL
jgi:hypothetical protein